MGPKTSLSPSNARGVHAFAVVAIPRISALLARHFTSSAARKIGKQAFAPGSANYFIERLTLAVVNEQVSRQGWG
jgi:hypothetical protein